MPACLADADRPAVRRRTEFVAETMSGAGLGGVVVVGGLKVETDGLAGCVLPISTVTPAPWPKVLISAAITAPTAASPPPIQALATPTDLLSVFPTCPVSCRLRSSLT